MVKGRPAFSKADELDTLMAVRLAQNRFTRGGSEIAVPPVYTGTSLRTSPKIPRCLAHLAATQSICKDVTISAESLSGTEAKAPTLAPW